MERKLSTSAPLLKIRLPRRAAYHIATVIQRLYKNLKRMKKTSTLLNLSGVAKATL